MDKLKYLPSENLKAMLFSLSGFTDYVVQNSKDCVLVDLSQMMNDERPPKCMFPWIKRIHSCFQWFFGSPRIN